VSKSRVTSLNEIRPRENTYPSRVMSRFLFVFYCLKIELVDKTARQAEKGGKIMKKRMKVALHKN
jgi:hypothetical protein